ncbi:MAG: pseudouridine synthase [Bacteriovoracaceae bacterium]
MIRLQKFIADCGYTSRRKAEDLIVQGKVKVNGSVADVLGTKVDPDKDIVEVEGRALDLDFVEKVYAVLHKPRGYMTTLSDPEGRPTVIDFFKDLNERIYPVGRLDYLSEGLLIMTNDGELGNTVIHPRYEVIKTYEVKVFGLVNSELLRKLRKGLLLEDGFVKPISVRVIKQLPSKTWLEFRLGEGKNREIRRICEAFGLTVDKLRRVAIGNLSIENLAPGKVRYFNKFELLKQIGINEDGSKRSHSKEFISKKSSVKMKRLERKEGTLADNEIFKMFRKESYFDAAKSLQKKRT